MMNFKKIFRLSGFDVTLILIFFLILGAQAALVLQSKEGYRGEWRSSFVLQEKEVQARLQTTVTVNREVLEAKIREKPELVGQIWIATLGAFIVMLGSMLCLIRFIQRVLNGLPIAVALGSPPPPGWTLREIFRLIFAIVVVSQLAVLIQYGLHRFFQWPWFDYHVAVLTSTFFIDLSVILGVCFLFSRHVRTGSPIQTGFGRMRFWKNFLFGMSSYLTFLPFLGLIMVAVSAVTRLLHVQPSPQMIFTIYLTESRTPVLGWMLFLVTATAPVAEEMLFRGVLYRWLRVRIGVWQALGLTAVLFGALHANAVVFFPILCLGLLFGWVYERTGSLVAPVTIHVLHNMGMLYTASLIKTISSL